MCARTCVCRLTRIGVQEVCRCLPHSASTLLCAVCGPSPWLAGELGVLQNHGVVHVHKNTRNV